MDIKKVFGNDTNPIWLEIGAGRGRFALETAKLNPNVNFLAVEKISNVIIEPCEKAMEENPDNCFFMNCRAEHLNYYIKDHTVDRIYLNFSCPYPKNTYKNSRLTYYRFLEIYRKLLKKDGYILLKTDNMHFYEYSVQSLSENGYILKNISLDLHNSNIENPVITEYEEQFSSKGQPIYYLEAHLK